MTRKVLLIVLALGTVAGYAGAIRSHHYKDRHHAWKEEVADLCVSAAQRKWDDAARGHSKAAVKP